MHGKTIALLLVLLVGLGGFFYVYDVRQAPVREKAAAEKDRLWKGLESKDIEEVTVARGAETLRLRRSGDAWGLAAPVEGKAERQPVDDLLTSLTAVRMEREIDPSPAKLADFGLEPPAAEISFRAKGQEHRLRLGTKTPTGIWVYAQSADKPAVFLVPDSILRDAQRGVADFRDKTLVAFERKDVKGLEVEVGGGPKLAAALKGPDDWQLTEPTAVAADRDTIGGLLDRLQTTKIKEFLGETRSPAELGLDRPTRVTLFLGAEKERVAKTLRFGKPVPEKKAVYAQREGEPAVFLVDEALARAVPTTATALRDKTVLTYDRDKLERLELESPKGKVALALDGGKWRITAPAALKADDAAVNQLLGRIRELRARDFLAEDQKTMARFGLDRPQVRLALWEKEAKEPRALLLAAAKEVAKAPGKEPARPAGQAPGKEPAKEPANPAGPEPAKEPAKDDAVAYATLSGGGPVVSVEARILDDLARSADELRDRSLFGALEERDVTRVEVQQDDLKLVLERQGADDWRLVAPRKGKVRPGAVSDLVWMLRDLKWRQIVAEQGWVPAQYGLERPATLVTLTDKTGKTVAALAVGTRDKGEAHVRVPGQPALYLIESKGLSRIPATAEGLLS